MLVFLYLNLINNPSYHILSTVAVYIRNKGQHVSGVETVFELDLPGTLQFSVNRQRLRHRFPQLARPQRAQVATHCLYHALALGGWELRLAVKQLAAGGVARAGAHVRVGVVAAVL